MDFGSIRCGFLVICILLAAAIAVCRGRAVVARIREYHIVPVKHFLVATRDLFMDFFNAHVKRKIIYLTRHLSREDSIWTFIESENPVRFEEHTLRQITRNYCKENLLGEGGFSKVYFGTFRNEKKVAIKVLKHVDKNFENEVKIQCSFKHKNVVKVLGYCIQDDAPMLVYEFVPNGDLCDLLHKEKCPLSLDQRLEIAHGSAEALSYIHSLSGSCILHGDIKPANILLDADLKPKISDFGLSTLLSKVEDEDEDTYTFTIKGTKAYLDPVFLETGLLTQKSDIYSFGVVLMELITRVKAAGLCGDKLVMPFRSACTKENTTCKMFDKEIVNEGDILTLERISELALQCVSQNEKERPDMQKVVHSLLDIKYQRLFYHKRIRSGIFRRHTNK